MRVLAVIAAIVFSFASGSVAFAQHGRHHGNGNGGGEQSMSCCKAMQPASDDAGKGCADAGMKDGKCDMEECCEGMMDQAGMGDMMGQMGDMMGDMMGDREGKCGRMPRGESDKMKCCCCKMKTPKRDDQRFMDTKPTLR